MGDMALDSEGGLWLITSEIDTTIHLPAYSSYLPIRAYLSRFYEDKYQVVDDRFRGALKMIFDKSDRLWFINSKKLFYLDDNRYVELFELPDDKGLFEWITIDPDNNIWAGGMSTPLLKITTVPEIKVDQITNASIPTVNSTAACVDKDNNLWLTLWDNGIGKRDESENWTIYSPSNSSLPTYQNFWCLTSDKENNIWAGTGWNDNSINLMKFDGTNWQPVTIRDDMGNAITGTVRKLYSDNSRIWIVSEKAVNNAFDSNFLITFDGMAWNRIYDIPSDDGIADVEIDPSGNKAWVATWNNGCFELILK
jgi:ligand-binding sensor domain-containing protein